MDTDGFVGNIKKENIYWDISQDFETRFDTSNYGLERPLPKGKNKKVIVLMKDELSDKIMKKIFLIKSKNLYLLNRRW